MGQYVLRHVPDDLLRHELSTLVERDRATTAEILAHIAEFDARKLFAPACASMKEYCVRKLRLSEDAAYKRIQAARCALDFPVLFEAVADGSLHLTGLGLLVPHLNAENFQQLVDEAAWRPRPRSRSCWHAGSRPPRRFRWLNASPRGVHLRRRKWKLRTHRNGTCAGASEVDRFRAALGGEAHRRGAIRGPPLDGTGNLREARVRARRRGHGRESPAPVPHAQPTRGRVHVRSGVHEARARTRTTRG